MVADDVAAADGVEADFLFGAFAGDAGAAVDGDVLEVPAEALGGGLAEVEGGAGGGILLAAVVALDDFAVVAQSGEGAGGLRDEGVEQVDAEAHVGGEHDGDLARGLRDGGLFGRAEAGGADDPRHAGGGHLRRGGGGGGRRTEIDGDVRPRGQRGGEVGAEDHAEGGHAGGNARVLAHERRAGAIDGGDEFEAGHGALGDQARHGQAHAPARAHDEDFPGSGHGYFTTPHA